MSEPQKTLSAKERLSLAKQDMTRSSLNANVPTTSAAEGGTRMLPVLNIKFYNHNPRTKENPRYQDIKASIRSTRRLDTPLVVTLRPGEIDWMIAAGGNTRLQILQELFQETGDTCFGMQQVLTRPWTKESDVQIAHLIENDLRADISFWDKARAILSVCEEIARESGESLSQRQQIEILKVRGFEVNRGLLSLYHYACKRLVPVGQFLSNNSTRELQPACNELVMLASRFGIAEDTLFNKTLDPAMEHYAVTIQHEAEPEFDVKTLIKQLHAAYAPLFGTTVAKLGLWLDTQKLDPKVTVAALQQSGNVGTPVLASSPASFPVTPTAKPPQVNTITIPAYEAFSSTPEITNDDDTNNVPATTDVAIPSAQATNIISRPYLAPRSAVQLDGLVLAQAQALAEAGGVADCLLPHDRAPLFFYMEPDQGNDTATDPYLREATWWVLAELSGQLFPEVSHQLPAQSRWHQLHAPDVNGAMQLLFTANAHYDLNTQQPMVYADYLPLLMWHEHGTGLLLANLFQSIHALREQQPERFGFCVGSQLFSRKEVLS